MNATDMLMIANGGNVIIIIETTKEIAIEEIEEIVEIVEVGIIIEIIAKGILHHLENERTLVVAFVVIKNHQHLQLVATLHLHVILEDVMNLPMYPNWQY